MAFEHVQARKPTSIKAVRVTLYYRPEQDGDPAAHTAHYEVHLLDQNGARMSAPGVQGDLAPHLTPAQIQGLLDFMADLYAKAEAELLPTPES